MAQQGFHFGLQFLLRFPHPPVAHGFVFARIRLDLCAIDGYLPQLHQIRPSGTMAMPAQRVHPAWPDVVSENSLWCRDPDAGPPPDSGTPRPQRSSARWLAEL